MKPKLLAFLSASTDPDDRKIVEWFLGLLKEFDIEPVFATHFPEPRSPQEKIEDFIRKSDVFVAVLTRRDKVEEKNLWKGPEWVQNEIAMAHTMRKPIALFVEQNVQIARSIGPYITDYVRFNRKRLDSIRTKAKRFITALCDRINTHTRFSAEEEVISKTIVEDVEEGFFESVIIKAARTILLRRYGRLDVSLKRLYVITLVVLSILSYFMYDYLFGTKIIGHVGALICTVVMIVMVLILGLAGSTRCKKCKSYFSERQRPVTYADIQRFPDLPRDRRLRKFVCEVCANVRYGTEEHARKESSLF